MKHYKVPPHYKKHTIGCNTLWAINYEDTTHYKYIMKMYKTLSANTLSEYNRLQVYYGQIITQFQGTHYQYIPHYVYQTIRSKYTICDTMIFCNTLL